MEGVSYYKYDVNVVNREEDVYVDGVLDKSKISISAAAKQSMHCMPARFTTMKTTKS